LVKRFALILRISREPSEIGITIAAWAISESDGAAPATPALRWTEPSACGLAPSRRGAISERCRGRRLLGDRRSRVAQRPLRLRQGARARSPRRQLSRSEIGPQLGSPPAMFAPEALRLISPDESQSLGFLPVLSKMVPTKAGLADSFE
jgi:hypothetical protein